MGHHCDIGRTWCEHNISLKLTYFIQCRALLQQNAFTANAAANAEVIATVQWVINSLGTNFSEFHKFAHNLENFFWDAVGSLIVGCYFIAEFDTSVVLF